MGKRTEWSGHIPQLGPASVLGMGDQDGFLCFLFLSMLNIDDGCGRRSQEYYSATGASILGRSQFFMLITFSPWRNEIRMKRS